MLEVWDNDMIDEVNISNQFFRLGDVGEFKVDALQSLISDFEDVPIMTNPVKCEGNEPNLNGVVITALDSMRPRKKIWDSIKNNDDVELFIDPRMGGRVARIYSVNPKTGVDKYEQTLYDDDESAEERCTERTILYNVLGISSLICKAIEDYMKDGQEGCSETILDYATYTLIHNKNM